MFALGLLITVLLVSGPTAAQDHLPNGDSVTGPQVNALQDRVRTDPRLTEDVSALRSDPEVREILDDPEIMAALQSGNTDVLLTNPKITKLLDNPKIQKITKELVR